MKKIIFWVIVLVVLCYVGILSYENEKLVLNLALLKDQWLTGLILLQNLFDGEIRRT